MVKKRSEERQRPNWDEYFMLSAVWTATRSSCQHLHTGAVIVRDKRIIASGYNGAPPNVRNCLELGCRKDRYRIEFDDKGKAVCRGTHAEINAISQIARLDLEGTIMYSLYFPCSSCAKAIAGTGISRVYYLLQYDEPDSLTQEIFQESGISLIKFERFDIEKYFKILKGMLMQRTV